MKYFVVSDIHGKASELDLVLKEYNPAEEVLIFLGDYIDRGANGLGVLETIMTMCLLHGRSKVKVLRGNHDNLLLDTLAGDEEAYATWLFNGGNKFLEEILQVENTTEFTSSWDISQRDVINLCMKHIPDKVDFLKTQTLLYYQDSSFLFTHAGFNSLKEDWRETSTDDFLWIRDHYRKPNNTGYINIFGHTRTSVIRGDKGDKSVWISPCKTYIGIDGGCAYGGQLNAVVLDSENLENLTVHLVESGEDYTETQNIKL